jgi:hypothetical protein
MDPGDEFLHGAQKKEFRRRQQGWILELPAEFLEFAFSGAGVQACKGFDGPLIH